MDVAEQRARTITIDGNRLTPIIEGPEILAALMKLIDEAKRSLRLLYYIYTADRTGALVKDALIRAIDRGVEVSLLIDGFGSGRTPESYFRELQRARRAFLPLQPVLRPALPAAEPSKAGACRRRDGCEPDPDRRVQYRERLFRQDRRRPGGATSAC